MLTRSFAYLEPRIAMHKSPSAISQARSSLPDRDEILSLNEVAEIFGVSRVSIASWIDDDVLPEGSPHLVELPRLGGAPRRILGASVIDLFNYFFPVGVA
jgi:predicted DNA-binding transcriptional regulator AlpA